MYRETASNCYWGTDYSETIESVHLFHIFAITKLAIKISIILMKHGTCAIVVLTVILVGTFYIIIVKNKIQIVNFFIFSHFLLGENIFLMVINNNKLY